jgi:hypothetical protein
VPEQEGPQFDHLAVEFPTDRITFGQMRRAEPQDFGPQHFDKLKGCDTFATHSWELMAARKAFAAAAGLPDPHPGVDRGQIISTLNDAYKEYGLSTGLEMTRQLVRDLESAVANQGRAMGGKGR